MVGARVLVTGATGGLGRVLVPVLRDLGFKVLATGRREAPPELAGPEIEFVPLDLSCRPLPRLVEGVETVFHLAALSAPWGHPSDFVSANVVATQRLVEAALSANCRSFIHVSTPSIYTEATDRLGITEKSALPDRWPNDYARTKHAAEQLVISAASPAFNAVVLRPRAIVSPFDTVLLPRLLRAARGGSLLLPNGGRALVELTDARDVVSALVAARDRAKEVSGQAFNISGGAPLPLAQVAAAVFKELGRPLRIRSIDARLALRLASVAEWVAKALPGRPEPPLTRYGAMVAGWSQTFDLAAASSRLGWRPRHSPEEALAWALGEMRHA